MKTLIRYCLEFVVALALVACQGRVPPLTPTQSIISSSAPNTPPQELETTTPKAFVTATPTPDAVTANVRFIPELRGNLFVGSFDSGVYIKIDFENGQVFRYKLPGGCQLLSDSQNAVCDNRTSSVIREIYIYNVFTQQREFTENRDVGRWDLTSAEHLLGYTRARPSETGISIYAFDFITDETTNIGKFDSQQMKLAIPWLSNSGATMIGLNHETLQWDYDDNWYFMKADTMKAEHVLVPENIAATDSVEWSPNDALVALVGFYRDDEEPHVGSLRCKKIVLLYDPVTQIVKSLAKVPEGRCYTPIALYQDSIWSPDSSKLALILNQQDICIVYVSEGGTDCVSISDNYGTEYKVRSLVWSPDSNYLAVIGLDDVLQVYSLADKRMYLIADANELSPLPIGSNLVWGRSQP